MSSVLLTAFEPYGPWKTNASWLALMELTREYSELGDITTRLYPVDYQGLRRRLDADLQREYDVILHLGQAPGSSAIQFESIAVNVAAEGGGAEGDSCELVVGGRVAYRSRLPLARIVQGLRGKNIPAYVSYHAGTYLCNAAMYWSHYLSEQRDQAVAATMIHVPLATSQVVEHGVQMPSLPVSVMADAVRLTLDEIGRTAPGPPTETKLLAAMEKGPSISRDTEDRPS